MSKQNILISVIVPIYNSEKHIARCVRSLFGQTMLNDIEFIFVDDCSLDRSIEVLEKILHEEYPLRESQTTIIRHLNNQGSAITRHTGLIAAKGKYIAYCDSDDWVDRNTYRMIVAKGLLEDLDMVILNEYIMLPSGQWAMRFSRKYARHITGDNIMDFLLKFIISDGIVQKVVKKDIYNRYSFIAPASNIGEDLLLAVQLCYYCEKVGCIGQPLYYYWLNIDSQTHKPMDERCIHYKKNIDLIVKFLKEKGLYDKYKYQMSTFKLRCRNFLSENVEYKQWHSIYPELDSWEYISHMSIKDITHYLSRRYHINYLYKKLQDFYWHMKYGWTFNRS